MDVQLIHWVLLSTYYVQLTAPALNVQQSAEQR